MKCLGENRGSVLMEFIVVFPIYLVMFGILFAIGDMMVKSQLLASADRLAAFDVQNSSANGWQWVVNKLFPVDTTSATAGDESSSARQDKLTNTGSAWYADTRVQGPFSLRAAATAKDEYAMNAWTKGWVGYTYRFSRDTTSGQGGDGSTTLGRLLNAQRVEMWSKESNNSRTYNFYALKRVKYLSSQFNWRHNGRPVSDLVNARVANAHWYRDVYQEKWHDTVGDGSNSKNDPAGVGTFQDYDRYGQYVTWSK